MRTLVELYECSRLDRLFSMVKMGGIVLSVLSACGIAEKVQNRAIETRVHHLRARSAMIIYLLLLHYYLLYFSHDHLRTTAAPRVNASHCCLGCALRVNLDERPDNLLHSADERADGIIFSYFIVNEDDFRHKLMVLKYNGHGMCVGYQKISCLLLWMVACSPRYGWLAACLYCLWLVSVSFFLSTTITIPATRGQKCFSAKMLLAIDKKGSSSDYAYLISTVCHSLTKKKDDFNLYARAF